MASVVPPVLPLDCAVPQPQHSRLQRTSLHSQQRQLLLWLHPTVVLSPCCPVGARNDAVALTPPLLHSPHHSRHFPRFVVCAVCSTTRTLTAKPSPLCCTSASCKTCHAYLYPSSYIDPDMPPKKSKKRKAPDAVDTNGHADATPPDRATYPGWIEMESEPVESVSNLFIVGRCIADLGVGILQRHAQRHARGRYKSS